MRRLARRLFTFCSAVSLLICAGIGALWIGSYAAPGGTSWGGEPRTRWHVSSQSGRLTVQRVRVYQRLPYRTHIVRPGQRSEFHGVPGVVVAREEGRMRPRVGWEAPPFRLDLPTTRYSWFDRVETSYWLLFMLAALLPAVWVRRAREWRRQSRAAQNLCAACGYDLRASPGRCPECGAPVSGSSADRLVATALPEGSS